MIQPKPKSNRVCFLSYFRNLKKYLKQKPYPMPKINGTLLKLYVFQYATSLGLNVGYYYIRLSKNASNLCTIIILWGKYCYKCLSTGISNSPEIFQHEMNDLFNGFGFIPSYIYDLLILTKGGWTDHVQNLELKINKLKEK